MTKAQLLEVAASVGVKASSGNTKAEIISAIKVAGVVEDGS